MHQSSTLISLKKASDHTTLHFLINGQAIIEGRKKSPGSFYYILSISINEQGGSFCLLQLNEYETASYFIQFSLIFIKLYMKNCKKVGIFSQMLSENARLLGSS